MSSRGAVVVAGLSVLLLTLVVLGLAVGAKELTVGQVLDALSGGGPVDARSVVLDQRLPRTLLAVVAGVGLAVAGVVMAALTRNPLADPGLLGVNAGAAAAVAIAVGVVGARSMGAYVAASLIGSGLVTGAVYVLARRNAGDAVGLTLAGVALGAVLSGVTDGLTLAAPSTFASMRVWSAGATTGRDIDAVGIVMPVVVVGALLALVVARHLDILALGDDTGASLGIDVRAVRVWSVVAVTLLAGGATAAAGPIGFIGLIAAHAGRAVVGPDIRRTTVVALLFGPILVLGADIVARFALPSGELPIGIVTAALGAPVLIAVVLRGKGLL